MKEEEHIATFAVRMHIIIHKPVSYAETFTVDTICGLTKTPNLSEHDLAAALFALEFAINNHASAIHGGSVRAHIELREINNFLTNPSEAPDV